MILFGNTSPYDIYLELVKCLNHQKKFSSGLKTLKRNDMYVHTGSRESRLQSGSPGWQSLCLQFFYEMGRKQCCGFRIGKLLKIGSY